MNRTWVPRPRNGEADEAETLGSDLGVIEGVERLGLAAVCTRRTAYAGAGVDVMPHASIHEGKMTRPPIRSGGASQWRADRDSVVVRCTWQPSLWRKPRSHGEHVSMPLGSGSDHAGRTLSRRRFQSVLLSLKRRETFLQ
jgi:hypothetical protein